MPPAQQQAGGDAQRASKHFLTFENFERMNTRSMRQALKKEEVAWQENLQPIAPNNHVSVPAPLSPSLAMLTGETVQYGYFMVIAGVVFGAAPIDYLITFTVAGAGIAVNLSSGATTTFAADGTFSAPDATQWKSERVLIIDPTAGYCTWDGHVFVKQGGVSPNITVTNGGSGYTSAPSVSITGGSGSGATAHALIVNGSVSQVILDTPGVNYKATDTLTVGFSGGGGSSAAASAHVWPFTAAGTSIAVFQGRVWTCNGRVLTYTGTGGYDDVSSADAAGSSTIQDADLKHAIYALRSLNNYLYIFGDNSIKQIGTITVSGSATLFAIITIASDIGTPWPQAIASYNRLVVFGTKTGVYGIFGATVQKLSDDLDGIFKLTSFSQVPQACLFDLNNIHYFGLLLSYLDPVLGTRSIIVAFANSHWWVISQGNAVRMVSDVAISGSTFLRQLWGSSGSDITQLLGDTSGQPVQITMRTALSHNGNLVQRKKGVRGGFAATVTGSTTVTMAQESENGANSTAFSVAVTVSWANNAGQPVVWENNSAQVVTFGAIGFSFPHGPFLASGKFLGATLTGAVSGFALNSIAIEYQETELWG